MGFPWILGLKEVQGKDKLLKKMPIFRETGNATDTNLRLFFANAQRGRLDGDSGRSHGLGVMAAKEGHSADNGDGNMPFIM